LGKICWNKWSCVLYQYNLIYNIYSFIHKYVYRFHFLLANDNSN
jgi:hypothetical protein